MRRYTLCQTKLKCHFKCTATSDVIADAIETCIFSTSCHAHTGMSYWPRSLRSQYQEDNQLLISTRCISLPVSYDVFRCNLTYYRLESRDVTPAHGGELGPGILRPPGEGAVRAFLLSLTYRRLSLMKKSSLLLNCNELIDLTSKRVCLCVLLTSCLGWDLNESFRQMSHAHSVAHDSDCKNYSRTIPPQLVVVNVSDHYNRTRLELGDGDSHPDRGGRVVGCLLGTQKGRTVEVVNSFEMIATPRAGGLDLDPSHQERRKQQYKEVFPELDVVGWYTSGTQVSASHKIFDGFTWNGVSGNTVTCMSTCQLGHSP